MKAFGENCGAYAAFLLVAGGVSLLTAFAIMPERDANGRPVAGWTGLADAAPARSDTDSRPNNPLVFAFEMTDPLAWVGDSGPGGLDRAGENSLASPDRSLAAARQRPGTDPGPLSKEMREIAEYLASIAPAVGAPVDSAQLWGSPSAREVAAAQPPRPKGPKPAKVEPAPGPAPKTAVSVALVPNGTPAGDGRYVVIGSFKRMASARVLLGQQRAWQPDVLVAEVGGQRHYRIVLGPFSEADAEQVRLRMAEHGIEDAWSLEHFR